MAPNPPSQAWQAACRPLPGCLASAQAQAQPVSGGHWPTALSVVVAPPLQLIQQGGRGGGLQGLQALENGKTLVLAAHQQG